MEPKDTKAIVELAMRTYSKSRKIMTHSLALRLVLEGVLSAYPESFLQGVLDAVAESEKPPGESQDPS